MYHLKTSFANQAGKVVSSFTLSAEEHGLQPKNFILSSFELQTVVSTARRKSQYIILYRECKQITLLHYYFIEKI